MFIAHLPAGYILTKYLQKKFRIARFLWLGLFASIVPDLDLFYFYLIDHRQNLHHSYWIHTPVYWLLIALAAFFLMFVFRRTAWYGAAVIFFSNIFLHLFLDTLVGKISWLYPWSDTSFSLFEVPALYDFWVYNFIFHWTFLFEIFVVAWAILIFIKSRKVVESQT